MKFQREPFGGYRLPEHGFELPENFTEIKSVFLATMSHELRTPLNAVIGFSELLAGGELTEQERAEYISGINLSGKSLLSLINDILDFSKLEADQMKIVPAPTDLGKISLPPDPAPGIIRQYISGEAEPIRACVRWS